MSPSISHHGGASGVTGSCHRLQIALDRALLVDCGLFQGEDAVGADQLEQHRVSFPVDDIPVLESTYGYQAHGTPGRAIQHFGPKGGWVELDGERIDVRAQVHTIGGYSADADQNDLMNFIQGIPQPPKEIRLVHGERDVQGALKAKIETRVRANRHQADVTFAV